MGVIYKFTDDVADFIVRQKKKDPKLSCRTLADTVHQKFKIVVSKSAVNNIIKSQRLSSPVGRPTKLGRPRKFKIPEEKKKQLLTTVRKERAKVRPAKISKKKEMSTLKAPKPKPFVAPEPPDLAELTEPIEAPQAPNVSPKVQKVPPPPDVVAEPEEQLTPEPPVREAEAPEPKKVPPRPVDPALIDGMGNFFLKAAEWELLNTSILGKILRAQLTDSVAPQIDTSAETLLYLKAFGMDSLEDLRDYASRGLWTINGIKPVDYNTLFQIVSGIDDTKALSSQMFTECRYIFSEINSVKIHLDDNSTLFLDGKLKTVNEEQPSRTAAVPVNKMLGGLSRQLINNVQSVIIGNVIDGGKIKKEFYKLFAAFENLIDRRMTSVALLGEGDEQTAKFTAIPSRKRSFIAGAVPCPKELTGFTQTLKEGTHHFKDEEAGQEFDYHDFSIEVKPVVLNREPLIMRCLVFADGAVLTNIAKDEMSAQQILQEYFKQWPQVEQLTAIESDLDSNRSATYCWEKSYDHFSARPALMDLIGYLLSDISLYAQRHFFSAKCAHLDFAAMKEQFYGLPGSVEETKEVLHVRLNLPYGYAHREDLLYAVKRVNDSHVKTQAGKRLVLIP